MSKKRPTARRYFRGGNASICQWTVQAHFRTKRQADGFVRTMLARSEVPLDFEFENEGHERFTIEIRGTWANNLRDIAKWLSWWDFDENLEGEEVRE